MYELSRLSIYTIAIDLFFLAEFIIWIVSRRGVKRDRSQDGGTVIYIILAFWISLIISYCLPDAKEVGYKIANILLPEFCYYVGSIIIILGTIIRVTSVMTLKKAFTLSVQTTDEQKLIKKGLYKYIRNPAYTGSITSLIGVAIALRSVFAPILVLAICVFAYGKRIKVEEKALRKQFGQEFNDYCKNTYKVFPFVW